MGRLISSLTCRDEQNLYVAEVNSAGSMTNGWLLKGSAIQIGDLGHGPQENSISVEGGLRAMVDDTVGLARVFGDWTKDHADYLHTGEHGPFCVCGFNAFLWAVLSILGIS